MIEGGNWWRANEIVMRHLTRRFDAGYRFCDEALAHLTAVALDALLEPDAQRRGWLVSQPQPRELYHRRSQPRIAGLRDPLFVSDRSALPGGRRQPSVGRQLPSVAEAAEQPFRPEYCRKFRSHPLQLRQHRRRRGAPFAHRLEKGIPFRLDRLQLRQD